VLSTLYNVRTQISRFQNISVIRLACAQDLIKGIVGDAIVDPANFSTKNGD
jgi:hypothetical protein